MSRWQQGLLLFASGALHVAAFAPLGWWPLSFLSLAVLFHGWHTATPREAAWQGYAWGLGCFLVGVSWVYVSMHDVGGMPAPVAALMTLLFALYLAIYPALSGWLAARVRKGPVFSLFVIAAAWTLGECLRGLVATGFPWLAIGYAQTPPSPLAGYAPLLGVYGVGFVVALMAAALAQLYRLRRAAVLPLALCIGLLLIGAGLRMVHWTQPHGEAFSVSLLQGNVPQSLKWDPQRLSLSLDTYAGLAQAHPAQLMVLPETAIPLMFNEIPRDHLRQLIGTGRHVLIGAAVGIGANGYANGAVMLTPQLEGSAYFKHHLVPFGEFVPAGFQWFLDLMHIPMSNFTAGKTVQDALLFDGQKIMPNICYEDLFGEELIRGAAGATLLVNLSNTAWFGDSLAQPQHLQIAQMRALETGRMMLRATNTGMTAAINPDGTVAAVLPAFTRAGLTVEAQGYTGMTPYMRYGNWGILLLAAAVLGTAAWRSLRRSA
ncbi:MAG TPA: apolipoprotein N-acyltransferase [Rhodocyclaceae bacterium]|nr:apolipoprotein N-acyltransferase [Rhodocyclaceae bacterium]